jgi:hypothetical protein
MSEANNRPSNTELRGDDKGMPDRGTSTGVTDTYGADLGQSAKNSMGSITGATKSNPADQCINKEDRI